MDQREVKHVNNAAVKKRSITAFGRKELGDAHIAVRKNETVKGTVNNVADGSWQKSAKSIRSLRLLPLFFIR